MELVFDGKPSLFVAELAQTDTRRYLVALSADAADGWVHLAAPAVAQRELDAQAVVGDV